VRRLLPGKRAWTETEYEQQQERRKKGRENFRRICKQVEEDEEDKEQHGTE